jgi:hypothetical protein
VGAQCRLRGVRPRCPADLCRRVDGNARSAERLALCPKCDKASLKLPPKESQHESPAEVSVRTTQPSPAGSRPGALPAGKDQQLIEALIELLLSAAAPQAAKGGAMNPKPIGAWADSVYSPVDAGPGYGRAGRSRPNDALAGLLASRSSPRRGESLVGQKPSLGMRRSSRLRDQFLPPRLWWPSLEVSGSLTFECGALVLPARHSHRIFHCLAEAFGPARFHHFVEVGIIVRTDCGGQYLAKGHVPYFRR